MIKQQHGPSCKWQSGRATIDATGLLTALDNGTITARATAHDGSEYMARLINISKLWRTGPVTSIAVLWAGGANYDHN